MLILVVLFWWKEIWFWLFSMMCVLLWVVVRCWLSIVSLLGIWLLIGFNWMILVWSILIWLILRLLLDGVRVCWVLSRISFWFLLMWVLLILLRRVFMFLFGCSICLWSGCKFMMLSIICWCWIISFLSCRRFVWRMFIFKLRCWVCGIFGSCEVDILGCW